MDEEENIGLCTGGGIKLRFYLQWELGNEEKAAQCRKLAAANGWHTISMRDDFKTIYGDDVKRTVR